MALGFALFLSLCPSSSGLAASTLARTSSMAAAQAAIGTATNTYTGCSIRVNHSAAENDTHYHLPQSLLARSHSLYLWRTSLDFASPAWGVIVFLTILFFHGSTRVRDWAVPITRKIWLQGFCFFPVFFLLVSLLLLPPALVSHHVSLVYGQSIQGWASWFLDWAKVLGLNLLVGTLIFSGVFAIVRRSRHWWLWIWLLSLPLQVFAVFILPLAIDPLFNHFTPLNQTNPDLVQQLEKVVEKANVQIPPSRMFLMQASDKVTGANAYVTGFGTSKRVVIWDTLLKDAPRNEVLFIFGHELGHYVLHHIVHGLILGSIISFFFLWAGFHLLHYLVRRYGARWRIDSLNDWAAVAVMMLVLTVLSFFAEPFGNSISRAQEHAADVFGEEVVHGIVADPGKTAAASFQRLGEQYLEYPCPNAFVVFWTYSHPPTSSRIAFAASYNPWLAPHRPRYFSKPPK
jgi:Zn-dependent protease with chaperone function